MLSFAHYKHCIKSKEDPITKIVAFIVELSSVQLVICPFGHSLCFLCPFYLAFGDFVAPEEHERLREEFAAFKVKGEVQDVDRTLIRADGSRLVVSINGRVSHDNEGSLRTHCILKDIALQKRDEADLRKSERRFRALAENIDDVFWMSSPGVTEQIYVSPAYERIWGRPVKEVLSVPRALFMDSIHPDDRADFITMAEEYHALCKAYEHEYRIIKPDGQVRPGPFAGPSQSLPRPPSELPEGAGGAGGLQDPGAESDAGGSGAGQLTG